MYWYADELLFEGYNFYPITNPLMQLFIFVVGTFLFYRLLKFVFNR